MCVVAREFIEWLAPVTNARWLDVGCGSGALTQTILATAAPRDVLHHLLLKKSFKTN